MEQQTIGYEKKAWMMQQELKLLMKWKRIESELVEQQKVELERER